MDTRSGSWTHVPTLQLGLDGYRGRVRSSHPRHRDAMWERDRPLRIVTESLLHDLEDVLVEGTSMILTGEEGSPRLRERFHSSDGTVETPTTDRQTPHTVRNPSFPENKKGPETCFLGSVVRRNPGSPFRFGTWTPELHGRSCSFRTNRTSPVTNVKVKSEVCPAQTLTNQEVSLSG